MPGKALTTRQRRFAEEFIKDGNGTQAAIRAGFSPKGAKVHASRMLTDDNIMLTIDALRAPVVEAAQLTLASHLSTLEDLREAAKEAGQHGAAISAEVARGKASGLYTEKREVTFPKGGGVLMVPTPVSPAEWAAQVAARQAALTASEGQ